MEDQRHRLLGLEQPVGHRVDPRWFALQVTLAIILAWLPVPVTVLLGRPAGWAATLLLALLVWGFCGRGDRFVLAVGFIASSALSASGLVTPQTIYQPVVVTGAAFALAAGAPILRDRRLPALPPAPVLAALGAYLAWAAVSTAFSIDRRSSLVYLVGMLLSLVATFVVLPAAVRTRGHRRWLFAALAGLAVAVAFSHYLLALTGPITIWGRPLGDYLLTQLVIFGKPTGLVVPRVAGIYLAPAAGTAVLVVGLAGSLALRLEATGRTRLWLTLIAAFIAGAVVLSQARDGLVMGVVVTGALAGAAWLGRRVTDWASLVIFLLLGLLALGNLSGSLAFTSRTVAVASGSNDVLPLTHSGTELSGRAALWEASIQAVKLRPLVGSGPGTNPAAISPYLTGIFLHYRGLTSHSIWFRTAVEMGISGLLVLLLVLAMVALAVARRLLLRPALRSDPTYVALIACAVAIAAGLTFESALLGGLAYTSLFWATCMGILVADNQEMLA